MWNKKAMNGSYVAIGMLIGIILAVVIVSALYNRGIQIPLPF